MAYQQIFSTFAIYDDEGYILVSTISYLAGHPLYETIYTQYGPAFIPLRAALFSSLNLSPDHDTTRYITIAVYLTSVLLAAMFILLETRSCAAAVIGLTATALSLDRLFLEPGHPQEVGLLSTLGILLLGSLLERCVTPLARRTTALTMGVCAGLLAATKLNLGLFAIIPLTYMLSTASARSRMTGLLAVLSALATLFTPCALLAAELQHGASFGLLIITSMGAATFTAVLYRTPPVRLIASTPYVFLVGASLVVSVSAVFALTRGTTPQGLWHGMVAQHQGFVDAFYHPIDFPVIAFVLGPFSLGVALSPGRTYLDPRIRWFTQAILVSLLLYCIGNYAADTFEPLWHGITDRGAAVCLLGVATPTLIVGLHLPTSSSTGRSTLCAMAAIQPLAGYPTPGSQLAVAAIPALLGTIIALSLLREIPKRATTYWPLGTRMIATTLIAIIISRDIYVFRQRASQEWLSLPGAAHLKVMPRTAAEMNWLATTLREECDTFVFLERSLNSLYLWTDISPPTHLNATYWPFLLSAEQQRRVINALEHYPRVLVVRRRPAMPWRPAESPLLDFLEQHTEHYGRHGRFDLYRLAHTSPSGPSGNDVSAHDETQRTPPP